MGEKIEDGFGTSWERCLRHDCDLHVVRPGKAQCEGSSDAAGCPRNVNELVDALDRVMRDNILLREQADEHT